MERSSSARTAVIVVYLNTFLLGAVVMGFEILGARYLYPYFGGSIVTWAAVISTVLGALMVGYFVGGVLADRYPSHRMLGTLILPAAAYMAGISYVAKPLILAIMEALGDGMPGLLVASAFLVLPPLTVLGFVSPFAVRLVLTSVDEVGRVAGRVYAISTMGSIVGTLLTAFALMPVLGIRSLTQIFAASIVVCVVSLFAVAPARGGK